MATAPRVPSPAGERGPGAVKQFVWQSLRREADGEPLPDVEAKFPGQVRKT
jgi:hypothetical protein